jgi:hypothetical protein
MRGFREVKYRPGRWLDFSGEKPVVRNRRGEIIAEDLHIAAADMEPLARSLAKELRLGEADTEDFIRRVKIKFDLR